MSPNPQPMYSWMSNTQTSNSSQGGWSNNSQQQHNSFGCGNKSTSTSGNTFNTFNNNNNNSSGGFHNNSSSNTCSNLPKFQSTFGAGKSWVGGDRSRRGSYESGGAVGGGGVDIERETEIVFGQEALEFAKSLTQNFH